MQCLTEPPSGPLHVAIIMDGNGRWAKERGLPRISGHHAAISRVRELVRYCGEKGVQVVTLYAFSSENWSRPEQEVSGLMGLFSRGIDSEVKKLHANAVKLRFIGERSSLSANLIKRMESAELLTASNTGLSLNIAMNYGARAELLQMVKQVVSEVLAEPETAHHLTASFLEKYLYTAGQPDPDLIIRTGGVQRLSNFLLWQAAYAELYFSPIYFPEFGKEELEKAFTWFKGQTRRFGQIDEQLGR